MNNYLIPTIIENDGRGEKSYDLYSRFLKDRIIWVNEVNDQAANAICAQLLFLQQNDSKTPIKMYINSPGGSITAGDGIRDTMDFVKSKGTIIETLVIGCAASYGAIILLNGTKGHRNVLPNSRVMIHQPLGGAQGQASDIEIKAQLILQMKKQLNEFIAKRTGQDIAVIEEKTDRDTWFQGQEAVDFGLADRVIATDSES